MEANKRAEQEDEEGKVISGSSTAFTNKRPSLCSKHFAFY